MQDVCEVRADRGIFEDLDMDSEWNGDPEESCERKNGPVWLRF